MTDQCPSGVGLKECGCGTEQAICPVNTWGGSSGENKGDFIQSIKMFENFANEDYRYLQVN